MTSTVVYNGGLRTTCTHLKSGSSFETDAPPDNHGKGERFSPTDLMATSLATCMLTVMGIKARSMGFDLDDIKVEVLKIMKQEPRRVGGIELSFHIPDALKDIDEKTKAIMRNTGNTCPVQLSLHPDIEVKVDWGGWANADVVPINNSKIESLKKYQLVKKLDKNEKTGYIGLHDKEYSKEINQTINSTVIPTLIFLIERNSDTDAKIKELIDDFYNYLTLKMIYENLDTEDREELSSVILHILELIDKAHLPIPG